MNQIEQKKLLTGLKKEETEIIEELSAFAKKDPHIEGGFVVPFPQEGGVHNKEIAHEIEEFERLNALKNSLEKRLRDIRITIKKIEAGFYGRCDNCSDTIERTRLQVMPIAKFCIGCARQNPREA